MSESKVEIKFGFGAPDINNQLAGSGIKLGAETADRLDSLNEAISILAAFNFLPETEITELMKKLSQEILFEMEKCYKPGSTGNGVLHVSN